MQTDREARKNQGKNEEKLGDINQHTAQADLQRTQIRIRLKQIDDPGKTKFSKKLANKII